MGKSLLRYNWTHGADIIILTKVLLRCMAQESSAFQISGGGKYQDEGSFEISLCVCSIRVFTKFSGDPYYEPLAWFMIIVT